MWCLATAAYFQFLICSHYHGRPWHKPKYTKMQQYRARQPAEYRQIIGKWNITVHRYKDSTLLIGITISHCPSIQKHNNEIFIIIICYIIIIIITVTISLSSWAGAWILVLMVTTRRQLENWQEVKVIWQKAPHGGPIPRLGVTPGGRKLYHWIPGVGFPISVP